MENLGSQKTISPKNPMKRRSRTRRGTQDMVINVAEARREINLALLLHRSSSSSPPPPPPPSNGCRFNSQLLCGSPYCYPLFNSMPQPEPVWSTTAPSVLATTPTVPSPYSKEALEFEWGESQQAASYSWWLGFLKTLDHQANVNGDDQEYSKLLLGNSNAFVNINATSKIGDDDHDDGVAFVDANSDQSSSLDEWLLFPATENEGEPLNLIP